MVTWLCANKFATTKIIQLGNGQENTFGGTIYFAVDCTWVNMLFN